MIVNMIHKFSHMYYSHNINIKYVESTIKYISFESIHYVNNLHVISSFIVFSDFDLYIYVDILLV